MWGRICCKIGLHDWEKIRHGRTVVGRTCAACDTTKFHNGQRIY